MTRAMLFLCALLALLSSGPFTQATETPAASNEKLTYEIIVTAPGAKSQGWHGVLFDENGQAMQVEAGKTVTTDIGELVSIAAVANEAWKPYGMISTAQEIVNNIMPDPWSYKLYKTNVGTRCPSWRGELLRAGSVVKPQPGGAPLLTPMGPFIWLDAKKPHGWVHKSWHVKADIRCG